MPFELPALPYATDAFEPAIDRLTMETHHGKHHAGYVAKLNDALAGTGFEDKPLEEILGNLSAIPEAKRTAVRNNGGGHANHSLFWSVLTPEGITAPSGKLHEAIETTFGSYESFKTEFANAATSRFGSGWAWLSVDSGNLVVESTPNQDSPLMEGRTPILGLDVWEHAYYLSYQNRRPDYVSAFFSLIHWQEVSRRYLEAI
ncbi:superoxide dismutase [Aeoliella mucimassa]|uniref:Superoxide dismutase n=1 Tax=Aeoliella mucimassa TaxID=2527972 RepID=A0A518AHS6_9BACT|nr:superoxide dismutase [Aeoliella mucimassa]QDU54279.1 Superoxide dismutase [Mn] [Aeoliella mucimassa]